MTFHVYLRLFIVGIILSVMIVFPPVLTAQGTDKLQTVTKLPPSSERWALVVGISHYKGSGFNDLYGQNDAKRIASDLEQYAGFDPQQVILLTDDQDRQHQPTQNNILLWLTSIKKNASPKGLLLFFFSGHGIEIEGENFLIPQGTSLNFDKTFMERTAVQLKDINDMLAKSHAKQVIVLVDACRNNPFEVAGYTSNKMTYNFAHSFDFEKQNSGIIAYATIYATSPGEESYQYSSKEMGYFSWVLDQSLRGVYDPGRQVTLLDLKHHLENEVPKLVRLRYPRREQKPDTDIDGYRSDQLVLVGPHAPSPLQTAMPESLKPLPPPIRDTQVRGKGRLLPGLQEATNPLPLQVQNTQDILVDVRTGLIWTRVDNGKSIAWSEARQYCADLTLGGLTSWRLPTIDELEGIYDPNSVIGKVFPYKIHAIKGFHFKTAWVWSGMLAGNNRAWAFYFNIGKPRREGIFNSTQQRALCVHNPAQTQ